MSGKFPSDDLRMIICDVIDQLKAVIPTEDEIEVFSNTPDVPRANPIKAEEFFRVIIKAGVDKYVKGLESLELLNDGSARLAKVGVHERKKENSCKPVFRKGGTRSRQAARSNQICHQQRFVELGRSNAIFDCDGRRKSFWCM